MRQICFQSVGRFSPQREVRLACKEISREKVREEVYMLEPLAGYDIRTVDSEGEPERLNSLLERT